MSQQPAPETATASESSTTDSHQGELRRALRHRHIHFIALGSAIGTGLFYGSAGAIGAAGPGVIFVYLLGGAIVYFMLRALGEMSEIGRASGRERVKGGEGGVAAERARED